MKHEKKIVGVIQARMGSKRFPGKMMSKLGDYSIIEWVLTRVKSSTSLSQIVLATSAAKENDVLEKMAKKLNIETVRGDEEDVLSRFVLVAQIVGADLFVRICADNPFVSGREIDRLVEFFQSQKGDYAFNHLPYFGNNYPNGLGGEIFPLKILNHLNIVALEEKYREHVTLYIWEHMERFKILTFPAPKEIAFPDVVLDVDAESDLKMLNSLDCSKDIHCSPEYILQSYSYWAKLKNINSK